MAKAVRQRRVPEFSSRFLGLVAGDGPGPDLLDSCVQTAPLDEYGEAGMDGCVAYPHPGRDFVRGKAALLSLDKRENLYASLVIEPVATNDYSHNDPSDRPIDIVVPHFTP